MRYKHNHLLDLCVIKKYTTNTYAHTQNQLTGASPQPKFLLKTKPIIKSSTKFQELDQPNFTRLSNKKNVHWAKTRTSSIGTKN